MSSVPNDSYSSPQEAIEALQADPLASIAAARAGSILDLKAIAFKTSLVPASLLGQCLDVFCRHLSCNSLDSMTAFFSASQLPVQIIECLSQTMALALTSLRGIGNIFKTHHGDVTLYPVLLRHWEGVFRWMTHLSFKALDEALDIGKDGAMEIWETICAVLVFLPDAGRDFSRKLLKQSDIFSVISRLWIFERRHVRFGEMEAAASLAFVQWHDGVALDNSERKAMLDSLLDVADGNIECVADLALLQYHGVPGGSSNVVSLDGLMGVLAAFALELDHPVGLAILRRGGIPRVIKALIAFHASPALSSDEKTAVLNISRRSFHFLHNACRSHGALPWIEQALRNGLLCAVVACAPAISDFPANSRRTVKQFLANYIPQHLLYTSIIDAAAKAMDDLSSNSVKDRVMGSVISAEWDILTCVLLERIIFRHIFKLSTAKKGMCSRICDNCGKQDKKGNFKQCAGCRLVLYCSRDCQVAAWKSKGHKLTCKAMLDGLDEDSRGSERDMRFCTRLTGQEVGRHFPALLLRANLKYPTVPIKKIGFSVDYSEYPPTLDVCKADELHTSSSLQTIFDDASLGIIGRNVVDQVERTGAQALLKTEKSLGDTKIALFSGGGALAEAKSNLQWPASLSHLGFERVAGQDPEGNSLPTVRDWVDDVISLLRFKRADDWLSTFGAKDRAEHLHEKIDKILKVMTTGSL